MRPASGWWRWRPCWTASTVDEDPSHHRHTRRGVGPYRDAGVRAERGGARRSGRGAGRGARRAAGAPLRRASRSPRAPTSWSGWPARATTCAPPPEWLRGLARCGTRTWCTSTRWRTRRSAFRARGGGGAQRRALLVDARAGRRRADGRVGASTRLGARGAPGGRRGGDAHAVPGHPPGAPLRRAGRARHPQRRGARRRRRSAAAHRVLRAERGAAVGPRQGCGHARRRRGAAGRGLPGRPRAGRDDVAARRPLRAAPPARARPRGASGGGRVDAPRLRVRGAPRATSRSGWRRWRPRCTAARWC
jgi:hypothetical protein